MRGIKPAVAAVLGVLVLSGVRAIAATPDRIHLPTRADAIAAELGAEQILNGRTGPLPSKSGLGGLETRLPGPATDRERITVDVGPTGEPVAVRAVQRLHLTGLGDFSFKVPGPATDVEG